MLVPGKGFAAENFRGVSSKVLSHLVNAISSFFIQGGAIGNGVFNREFMSDTKLKFFYHHGLMGTT